MGGSAITDKSKHKFIRYEVIEGCARAIKKSLNEKKFDLIIVHGGGSFGHPIASRYELHEGLLHESSWIGFSETIDSMRELNMEITRIFRSKGLPVIPIQPSAFMVTRAGKIQKEVNLKVIRLAINRGFIPILWGDAVLDEYKGCAILSGDEIILYLGRVLRPNKIIFGTDVDGIYQDVKNRKGLIRKITKENYQKIMSVLKPVEYSDVTGGIIAKVKVIAKLANMGIKVYLINILKPENLYAAILDHEVMGTIFDFT